MSAPASFQTTVGTSVIAIGGTEHPGYVLINLGAATIYLGGPTVTTGNGFPILTNQTFSPSKVAHDTLSGRTPDLRLYGISGSAGNDVRVLVPARIDP